MDKSRYSNYLKVDCWQLRRAAYLRKCTECELCGGQSAFHKSPLQIHHLSYERLGAELDSDLVAVCELCHRAMHKLDRSTPTTWIRQYIESCLQFGINPEKMGRILVALDKVQKGAAA